MTTATAAQVSAIFAQKSGFREKTGIDKILSFEIVYV